ncbi:conserved hypothetical protein [Coccidioides posadasii str. Silveira]|uniref:Uncharacterized protein n=2 Tax=Coccidioides posadasii TaxID=199306 RepID=E9DE35_COCPS|nr:conserved hypothetical protein [Coccidioides posadasii str. Silveira]KMM70351.1 hypothetical protein CPAG_06663 [Coccidioides posadasii RMSCC 3488]
MPSYTNLPRGPESTIYEKDNGFDELAVQRSSLSKDAFTHDSGFLSAILMEYLPSQLLMNCLIYCKKWMARAVYGIQQIHSGYNNPYHKNILIVLVLWISGSLDLWDLWIDFDVVITYPSTYLLWIAPILYGVLAKPVLAPAKLNLRATSMEHSKAAPLTALNDTPKGPLTRPLTKPKQTKA